MNGLYIGQMTSLLMDKWFQDLSEAKQVLSRIQISIWRVEKGLVKQVAELPPLTEDLVNQEDLEIFEKKWHQAQESIQHLVEEIKGFNPPDFKDLLGSQKEN